MWSTSNSQLKLGAANMASADNVLWVSNAARKPLLDGQRIVP